MLDAPGDSSSAEAVTRLTVRSVGIDRGGGNCFWDAAVAVAEYQWVAGQPVDELGAGRRGLPQQDLDRPAAPRIDLDARPRADCSMVAVVLEA